MAVTDAAHGEIRASRPTPPTSRRRRLAARTGRALCHEWTVVGVGALVLAGVMTWPTLRRPTTTIPMDIGDPTMQAWQMAWSGHALVHDPARLWQSNTFYPERYSFAFTDTLLGYVPAGMIGTGPVAALLRYNIVYVLVFALAFVGAYALIRQLGSGWLGAAVAGAAFAYAPWRLAQAGHLQVLSTGGIPLSLAMLAHGHGWSLRHGYRPDRTSPGWAFAGWLVAAWQLSLGFGIGLPFAYVFALVCAAALAGWLRRRPPLRKRLLFADGAGLAVFAVVAVVMALPYLEVVQRFPYVRRSWRDVAVASPPLRGFFVSPGHSVVWGAAHADARAALGYRGEVSLLPGFALYGLAAVGLCLSIWTLRQRLLLAAGLGASVLFAMGTEGPAGGRYTYGLLYHALPGFDAIRTPGRLVVWTTLLLAVLAAGATEAVGRRGRHTGLRRLSALLPLLILAEGLNTTPHPVVPPAPQALATAQAPLLVLPTGAAADGVAMLWATDRFPLMVNGSAAFTPARQAAIREAAQRFPDADSVAMLRAIGVRSVVVPRDGVAGTAYEPALGGRIDGLPLSRRDTPDAVVYTLDPE